MKNTWKVNNPKGYVTRNGIRYKDGDPVPEEMSISSLRFLYQRGMINSTGKGSKAVTSETPLDTNWGTQDEAEASESEDE